MDEDDGCDVCGGDHITEHCPVLGYQEQAIAASESISKARLTLPNNLEVTQKVDGSVGVLAKETIPPKTKFGPLEARKSTQDIKSDDHFLLKVLAKDGSVVITFDTSDENECNWLCLVQPAQNELEQNCIAYQLGVSLFFSTTKEIKEGDEMKVWYAPQYAKKLGKTVIPDGKALTLIGRQDIFNASITEDFGELVKSLSFLTPKPDNHQPRNEIVIDAVHSLSNEIHLSAVDEVQEDDTQTEFEETVSSQADEGSGDAPTIVGGIYMFQCKRCPEKFERESDLARHIREHIFPWRTNPDVTPPRRPRRKDIPISETYSCDPCNFVFRDYKSYLRHLTKTKRHRLKCHYCSYQTHDKSELVEHLESEHKYRTEKIVKKEPKNDMKSKDNHLDVPDTNKNNVAKEAMGNEYLDLESEESENEEMREDTPPPKPKSPEALPTPSRIMPKRSLRGVRTTGVLADSVTSVKVVSGKKVPKGEVGRDEDESEDWKLKGQKRKIDDKSPQRKAKQSKIHDTKTRKPGNQGNVKGHKQTDITDHSTKTKPKNDKSDSKTNKTTNERQETKNPRKSESNRTSNEQAEDSIEENTISKDVGVENTSIDNGVAEKNIFCEDDVTGKNSSDKDDSINEKENDDIADHQTGNKCMEDVKQNNYENVIAADLSGKDQDEVEVRQPHDTDTANGIAEDLSADKSSAIPLAVSVIEDESIGDDAEKENNFNSLSEVVAGIVDEAEHDEVNNTENSTLPSTNQMEDLVEGVDYALWHTETGVFYSCTACNKRFTKFKYLRLHAPAHTNKYKCDFCDKKFTRKESLDKHSCEVRMELFKVIEEEGQTYFQCVECKKRFADEDVCRRHYSTHCGRFECSNCLKQFASHKKLMNHDCVDPVRGGTLFPCDICKQKFRTQKYLYRHMAMHTDIYKCEKCARCFSRKDSLQKHIMKCCPEFAEGLNIYSCEICSKAFATKLGLENHVLNCVAFHCKNCKKTFQSEEDLEAHSCIIKADGQDAGVPDTVRFQCKYCPKDFTSTAYLRRHEASHQGAFQCSVCSKKFARKEEHCWHYYYCFAVETLSVSENVECDQCEKVFQDPKLYREHYHSHTHPHQCEKCLRRFRKIGTLHMHVCPDSDGEFTCEVCDKPFRNERYLRRHQMCHGDPQFECPHCNRMFHRKDYLSDHSCVLPDGSRARIIRKNDTVIVKDTVVCHLCGKSFVSGGNLNKHIKIHGEKECECDICGKKFHYVGYLKEHKASVHEKKYQFQCSDCGKFLYSKTGLQQHMKQFHSEKIVIYTCGTCGKGFRQKGNLKTHMFSHSDQKCFECDICHKKFKYPEQVNRHRLHHTMSNKFSCEFCDRKFVKLYEQRRHMEVFHSGIVFVCGICGTKCGHRHTLTRHYKRKHPNAMNDLNDPSFISSLQKHSNESKASKAPLIKSEPILHMDAETATQSVTSIMSSASATTNTNINTMATSTTGTTVIQNPDGTLTEVRIEADESLLMPQAAAEALHSLQNVIYPAEHQPTEQQTHIVYENPNEAQPQKLVFDTQNVEEQTVTIPNSILETHTVESGMNVEEGEQTLVILQYVNSDGEEEQIIQSIQQ